MDERWCISDNATEPCFNQGLGSELMTHICRLVFTVKVLKEQVIYEEGTVGSEMCIAGML